MNETEIRELTDWLAVNVMGKTPQELRRWRYTGLEAMTEVDWLPHTDANDCKMLKDRMRADGYQIISTSDRAGAHVEIAVMKTTGPYSWHAEDPNELLATCLTARLAKEAENASVIDAAGVEAWHNLQKRGG